MHIHHVWIHKCLCDSLDVFKGVEQLHWTYYSVSVEVEAEHFIPNDSWVWGRAQSHFHTELSICLEHFVLIKLTISISIIFCEDIVDVCFEELIMKIGIPSKGIIYEDKIEFFVIEEILYSPSVVSHTYSKVRGIIVDTNLLSWLHWNHGLDGHHWLYWHHGLNWYQLRLYKGGGMSNLLLLLLSWDDDDWISGLLLVCGMLCVIKRWLYNKVLNRW